MQGDSAADVAQRLAATSIADKPPSTSSSSASSSSSSASSSSGPSDKKVDWADLDDEEIDESEAIVKVAGLREKQEDDEDEDTKSKVEMHATDASGQKQAIAVSDLYTSTVTFEQLGIRPELLKGVYDMKFVKPSKIQATALPIILASPMKHLIAQAQAGTGKTAAFTLGLFSRIDLSKNYPQVLVLCPTRELARQNRDVITTIGKYVNAKITLAVKKAARETLDCHILVGTPGTVTDFAKSRRFDPKQIRVFVLDEADYMLDQQGLSDQTVRVRRLLSNQCQILLFSATYSDQVVKFAEKVVPQPHVTIRLHRKELSLDKIQQFYVNCRNADERYTILSDIYVYLTIKQSIIFVEKRDTAVQVGQRMTRDGHAVSVLHGQMLPSERDRVIDEFRAGETKVLISTNVLSRGIDILQVSLIINYDMPVTKHGDPDFTTYLHRIGRTGRWNLKGIALNFVHDDRSRTILRKIEEFFQRSVSPLPVDQLPQLDRMLKEL